MQPIVPDVYVRAAPDGTWQVELNSDTLPKVLINQRYYAQVSKTTRSDKDKTYLADCLQTATWLVRALDQRAKTILKVSSEIVRQQDGFFAKGVQHLRPLNLKTVADAIGMHESTVSRVTANKYMATSRGIFELKYFFTSSIASADGGEAHSAEAVRHRIRQLIDAETAADVLSDDTIVDKLREAGIDIARRTVAKYREAMRIPSSVQRRREKQAADAAVQARRIDLRNNSKLKCLAGRTFGAAIVAAPDNGGRPHAFARFGKEHQYRHGTAAADHRPRRGGDVEIFPRRLFRACHRRQGRFRLSHRMRAASGFRRLAGSRGHGGRRL